ncbi:hypothetical protein SGRIM128S_02487 [Streptomyces griseomycini]|nr:hypothetical protein GCM10015536_60510 [Streptomyces griseomycini]
MPLESMKATPRMSATTRGRGCRRRPGSAWPITGVVVDLPGQGQHTDAVSGGGRHGRSRGGYGVRGWTRWIRWPRAGTAPCRTSGPYGQRWLRTAAARTSPGCRFPTRGQAEYGLPVSQRAPDVTQPVVGELVTNARKYASGPAPSDPRLVGDAVEVAVGDSEPVLPAVRAADVGRVGRHGLEIVRAVAQDFEVRLEPVGRRGTAPIALTDDQGRRIAGRDPCRRRAAKALANRTDPARPVLPDRGLLPQA